MHVLLSPLGFGLLVLLVRWLARARLPRIARYACDATLVACLILTTPLGANALVKLVESRVPDAATCAAPEPNAIVVLAGGFDAEPARSDDYGALTLASVRRLLGALRLYERTPNATLLIVGGGLYDVRESDVLADLARRFGVPPAAIATERGSTSTRENAERVAAIVPPVPRRIWLVSSALHLPRALASFRRAGFEPCAFASESAYLAPGGLGYFLPQSSALAKSEAALHEIVGAFAYALRGDR